MLSMAHAANISEGLNEGLIPELQVAANIGGPRESITKQPQQQTQESGEPDPASKPGILEPNTRPGERVAPALPSGTTRQIVVREIKVDDTLLKRLAARPVTLSSRLSQVNRKSLNAISLQVKRGNRAVARNLWGQFVASYATKSWASGTDIHDMIMWVLRESYLEQMEVLKDYAEKLAYYNKLKKVIRDHLAEMREWAARMDSRNATKTVEVNAIVRFPPPYRSGATARFKWARKRMNRDALQAYIEDLEGRLATAGNDAQLANVDMQNMLQKQQQTMQMMSQISKMMHDTAMAVLRNIGS